MRRIKQICNWRVCQRISCRKIGHFLFHKTKSDRCKKYYLCGIRIWKRNVSIYNYLDLCISRLAQAEAKKLQMLWTEIQGQKQHQHEYHALLKELEYKIQNLISNIDEGIKNKTKCIITAVEREQILYNNPFEIRVRTKWGWCDITEAPKFEERFRKLISGLPEESVGILANMLARLKLIKNANTKLDLYTPEEKIALKQLEAYNRSIFKISDSLYCYKNYLLPIKHFEASVFFYRHGLDVLKHPERFMDKAILDVGAFVGDSALIFSPLTKDKVYSFEASSENYNLLLKTIELNNLKNIVPVKAAVGAEKSIIEMKFNGSGTTSSIISSEPKYIETSEVIKIDDYVKENNLKVGLIKVDIEGAEQEFLKGAMQTIIEQKPTLLISIYHNIDDFLDIKPLIESWGLGYSFSIYQPIINNISTETLLVCEL